MIELLRKYEDKLIHAGLAAPGAPVLAGLDDELIWNRGCGHEAHLRSLFDTLSINSLVLLPPEEPYATCVRHLAERALESTGIVTPEDCETRTFLHDLPVVRGFEPKELTRALEHRKGVIILDDGRPWILATGTVSPEQGFVTCSSVCFACFVKLFSDALAHQRIHPCSQLPLESLQVLNTVCAHLPQLPFSAPQFMRAPFATEEDIYLALIEAGRATVEHGLVDSYFGNISLLRRSPTPGVLFISQTGSSLDELSGYIDPCPLDGSSTAALTASSELTAHVQALAKSGASAMLHGHPKFSVIMSMVCDKPECAIRGRCHLECREQRRAGGAPIVPGEVGTGSHGLCNTLPPALQGHDNAIVHGHGVFSLGREDFNQAFSGLLEVERSCREACLERLRAMSVLC